MILALGDFVVLQGWLLPRLGGPVILCKLVLSSHRFLFLHFEYSMPLSALRPLPHPYHRRVPVKNRW